MWKMLGNLMKKRRRIVEANINHCFKDKSAEWRNNLIEKIWEETHLALYENNFAWNADKRIKKIDVNLENSLSEILDDKLFEDLDILGPEVKDLVSTNPKIGKAIVRLGDILKKKDHELVNKIEKLSGKIVDSRKNSFPGEVISDFLQENKNYFSNLENFANEIFEKIKQNNKNTKNNNFLLTTT